MKLKEIPKQFKNEELYSHMEILASNNEFGSYGWYYPNKHLADKKYTLLGDQ